jgi:DHA2 family multidrug resistance protein
LRHRRWARVGRTLQRQIELLAYIDVLWLLMVVRAIVIPVGLILKPVDLGAPAKAH